MKREKRVTAKSGRLDKLIAVPNTVGHPRPNKNQRRLENKLKTPTDISHHNALRTCPIHMMNSPDAQEMLTITLRISIYSIRELGYYLYIPEGDRRGKIVI